MKKLFFILMVVMSFISIEAFDHEVRGVETRIVIYEGIEYRYGSSDWCKTWAAFEFTNLNSIAVSVDATLHHNVAGIRSKKSFILQPGESYRWKHENESYSHKNTYGYTDYTNHFRTNGQTTSWPDADRYYVEYKAYKLQ